MQPQYAADAYLWRKLVTRGTSPRDLPLRVGATSSYIQMHRDAIAAVTDAINIVYPRLFRNTVHMHITYISVGIIYYTNANISCSYMGYEYVN